jgi:hypothetical protein
MRPSAIRLLTLASSAAVALLTATDVDASSRHPRKHHHRQVSGFGQPGFTEPRAVGWTRPAVAPIGQGGDVCPGSGRSFECKVWPPPFDQDPDRKASGSDAGG